MKPKYDGISFDSELEVEYYKYLKEYATYFVYHPKVPITLVANKGDAKNNTYTPDFVVYYNDRCEIIETKGYNQFSYARDTIVHNIMLSKTEDELKDWLKANGLRCDCPTSYHKIKYMKNFGWVNFEFKNPNTLANQRKEKIEVLEQELKELKNFKRDAIRYICYLKKPKLTKRQLEFKEGFEEKLQEEM